MADRSLSCCDFCGRDTPNKSRICRFCTGGHKHGREYVAATMHPWDEWESELDDYDEDSLGPKLAENRFGIYVEEDKDWRKHDDV